MVHYANFVTLVHMKFNHTTVMYPLLTCARKSVYITDQPLDEKIHDSWSGKPMYIDKMSIGNAYIFAIERPIRNAYIPIETLVRK